MSPGLPGPSSSLLRWSILFSDAVAFHRQSLFFTLRGLSSSSFTSINATRKLPNFRCINEIPHYCKPKAVEEARKVVREYLHATSSLPFVFSELIANNSPYSLCNILRKVRFSAPSFSQTLRKLLRYEPINEYEFFLESIGIDYDDIHRLLPQNMCFSENRTVFYAAFTLSQFGFPWNTLGRLYAEEVMIFSSSSDELNERLRLLKGHYCFDNLSLVGICLAFPRLLLSLEGESSGDFEAIIDDLKRVYVGFDVGSCVEGNVDAWYEICCKVRLLYSLGCVKGKVGESMCENKELFFKCRINDFVRKADFLTKFGVGKSDVGLLLLRNPEILNFDLETKAVSVLKLLKHFGLEKEELGFVTKKYPHVLGRNKMANLANAMKALDLRDWFLEKLISSNGELLATYNLAFPDEDVEKVFIDGLKRLESSRYPLYMTRKVDFMKSIGFGENARTMKILNCLGGSSKDLQERFDCLLKLGMSYPKICSSIKTSPKILNQSPELLEQKVNFLCGETGSSLDYITSFPAILCFDLNRMKFRCRFHVWLRERGLCKDYAIATMIATSEKAFISSLIGIHPAIPKQYLECFSNRRFIVDDSEKLYKF